MNAQIINMVEEKAAATAATDIAKRVDPQCGDFFRKMLERSAREGMEHERARLERIAMTAGADAMREGKSKEDAAVIGAAAILMAVHRSKAEVGTP